MADAVSTLGLVVGALTALGWGLVLYKLRDLARDPGNLALRALCLALVAIAGSLTVQRLAGPLDQFAGRLDVGRVTANCLTLVAAGGGQAFLLYMASQDAATRRRVHRRIAVMAACVAAIALLYALTPPRYAIDDPYVRSGAYYHLHNAPLIAPYVFVHLGYVGWAAVQIALLAGRYARIATRPLLRFGLRLIVVGAGVGLGYVAAKFAHMALQPWTSRVPGLADAVIVVLFTTAILFLLIGATIPSWGPLLGLDRLANRAAALHAYRQLAPLWTELHRVNPTIALLAQPRGPTAPLLLAGQAHLRLVRRVVEIRDGYLALRPYTGVRAERVARRHAELAGLAGEELAAVTEAAVIAAAVRRHRSGVTVAADAPDEPDAAAAGAGVTTAPTDAAAEVAWLIRVARAYRRSPVVAATLAELGLAGGRRWGERPSAG